MKKKLPVVEKRLDEFSPTRKELKARVKKVGLNALVAGFGLLGTAQGMTAAVGSSPGSLPQGALQISNRKEKERSPKLVLQLGSFEDNMRLMANHRSHRSHSSHRSHYSSTGRTAPSRPPATTPPPAPSTSVPDQQIESLDKVTGEITSVDLEKKSFILKEESGKEHIFSFSDETKVRVLTPNDQTTTLGAIKAFSGASPIRKGKNLMVHWKQDNRMGKVTVQLTIFEF